MNTLYIDKDGILSDNDFTVTDDDGEDVFRVVICNSGKEIIVTLYNMSGETVSVIRSKSSPASPKYNIFFGEAICAVVSSRFSLFSADVKIDSVNGAFTVNGNCSAPAYSLYNNGKMFGSIAKKWFDSGAAYCITTCADENTAFFVSIVLAVELCVKKLTL
ncbi:MAG: hypothetical protein E7665_08120 [Ruminococcaceae bacterium]|nr:hypothetical protein [Oscillospiraceae bacterium]